MRHSGTALFISDYTAVVIHELFMFAMYTISLCTGASSHEPQAMTCIRIYETPTMHTAVAFRQGRFRTI